MLKCLSITVLVISFMAECAVAQPLWQRTNGPAGAGITEIAFDSAGGALVVAGAAFRTLDNGATWQQLSATPTDIHTLPNGHVVANLNWATAISTDVGSSWNTILNQSGPICVTLAGEIFVAASENIFRSSNEGTSWDTLGAPPELGRFFNFYTPTLFILTNDRSGGNLYRSTDNGANWGRVVNGLSLDNFYGDDLAGAPGGTMVYVCRDARYASTDDGRTWHAFSSDNIVGNKVAFDRSGHFAVGTGNISYYDSLPSFVKPGRNDGRVIANFNGSQVLVGAPAGGFWSASGGSVGVISVSPSSLKVSGPPTGTIKSMAPLSSGSILANSSGSLYRTTDQGNTWTYVTGDLSLLEFDSSKDILAAYGGTIKRTSDGGNNWSQLGFNLTNTGITSAVVDASGLIYAGTGEGVFRSSDAGGTWDQLNAGLSNKSVAALAVNSAGDIFAGTSTRIFKSTDHALSWTALSFAPVFDSVLYDSLHQEVSYGFAALTFNTNGDLIAVAPKSGVFWSHDNGTTWDSIGTGLKGKVSALLSTPSGHVFAGTDRGVFYLPAGGAAWVDANSGLDGVPVLSITRDQAGTVYLGTNGNGVYRSTQTYNRAAPASAMNDPVADSWTIRIYPDPMSATGRVEFNLAAESNIRIAILNSLGEELATLLPASAQPGSQTLSFDASHLAPGVYSIRISDGKSNGYRHFVVSR